MTTTILSDGIEATIAAVIGDGWKQGGSGVPGKPRCLHAHLAMVGDDALVEFASEVLDDYTEGQSYSLILWNDLIGRTQEQVLDFLDVCLDVAEQEERV